MTGLVKQVTLGRLLVLLLLAAALLIVSALTVRADQEYDLKLVPSQDEQLTSLTIEGVASRSVEVDGTVVRFRVSVLDDSVQAAVSTGNSALTDIHTALEMGCNDDNPEQLCVKNEQLQTRSIRIYEQTDWREGERVTLGFRYENELLARIDGVNQAGLLIDTILIAGGDHVRFDGINFTASGRAEAERLALLDAIDDAQASADAIAGHMGYEIVRIVELSPVGIATATETLERAAFAESADESFEPTPVFGGSESVTSRVRIVFELRPMPDSAD